MQHSYSAILRSVAVGDLGRTGRLEAVAADMSGYIYSFEPSLAYCAGLGLSAPCLRLGFPVHDNFAFSRQGVPPFFNRDHVFFFQAEDGIRDYKVTGVQTCALPI